MTAVEAGSRWRGRGASSADPGQRRIVEVVAANPDGFVEGVGWSQQLVDGRWQDTPQTSRKTRVRYRLFVQRYDRIEGE